MASANEPNGVHVIACGVLAGDLRRTAARLGLRCEVQPLEGGLHARPDELRRRLQEAIDAASARGGVRRIVLGYGVCGRGTVGLRAGAVPLILPRVHDCIALLLGSDTAYRRQFNRWPGTYYVSAGWWSEQVEPRGQERRRGPGQQADREALAERYGPQHAEAIAEFLQSWKRNYRRAVLIDTGAPGRDAAAAYARALADECGWEYEELPHDPALLEALLTTEASTDDVLVVPPGGVTRFDPLAGGLRGGRRREAAGAPTQSEAPDSQPPIRNPKSEIRNALGIDAGGTYTDAVVYDLADEAVRAKAKALTTRWDFTVGIDRALAQLPAALLAGVELVSVSTTLATNAIVEQRGQKVGLLVMPPYGLWDPEDIGHEPKAILGARLEIDGRETRPVDAEEVRRIAHRMADEHGVRAFAVSGFAGTVNPAHELEVQRIVRAETGRSVTCGHELSALLNFRTRAQTAVLNARIIPHLERFLDDVGRALAARGIAAPVMVVKGDGSLVRAAAARERPVETILSGPAASVAGARRLTGLDDAVVADMGGTTTDTAALRGGQVRVCEDGTRVGRWKTHVRALEMRTVGLGADSAIRYEDARLMVGPRRVAPVAWLAEQAEGVVTALDWLAARPRDFAGDTGGMELLALAPDGPRDARPDDDLRDVDRRVLDALAERPMSRAELAQRVGAEHWTLLSTARLEEAELLQPAGLTPTDLLHVGGQFVRWDAAAARRLSELTARAAGREEPAFRREALTAIARRLAIELLKKHLDAVTDPDVMDDCPACQALLENLLAGGNEHFAVRVHLAAPLVGIGAPADWFLRRAAELLDARIVIPPHAEVANAIGAATSNVVVRGEVAVRPAEEGGYLIDGLPGRRTFAKLGEAHAAATAGLREHVLQRARAAGTASQDVRLAWEDRLATAADGTELFLERCIRADLAGRPDVAG